MLPGSEMSNYTFALFLDNKLQHNVYFPIRYLPNIGHYIKVLRGCSVVTHMSQHSLFYTAHYK